MYSAEEMKKAKDRVEDLRNGGEAYWQIAEDAVCELNRAVKLLRLASREIECEDKNCAFCVPIDDFLSRYPEGDKQ